MIQEIKQRTVEVTYIQYIGYEIDEDVIRVGCWSNSVGHCIAIIRKNIFSVDKGELIDKIFQIESAFKYFDEPTVPDYFRFINNEIIEVPDDEIDLLLNSIRKQSKRIFNDNYIWRRTRYISNPDITIVIYSKQDIKQCNLSSRSKKE